MHGKLLVGIATHRYVALRAVREGDETIRRTQKLIVVAAVIIVIVAAGFGAVFLLRDRYSDYTTFWIPAVGKYAVYTQVNDTLFNCNWTMTTTVLSMNATHLMRGEVTRYESGGVYFGANWSAPLNLTFGNGYDVNYDMGWPVTVTEVGLETVSTPWGNRICICYKAVWPNEVDYIFVHNGVMLKNVSPESTSFQCGTWVMTSTNIQEVTHQS